jgi:hypothetical protein
MVKKGSITVFLTLMLSLILSLICTSIESVRMAAARTQILSGVDVGLYSLFGQYDRTVLRDFDLFLVDGSCGGGTLKMANIYQNMESYIKPVLKQNSQKLSIQQGGFTGYRLITDEDGEVFYHQVIQYMKDTLGGQGAQLLISKMQERETQTRTAKEKGSELESGSALKSYESEMDRAAQDSRQMEEAQKAAAEAANQGDGDFVQEETLPVQSSKPVVNPITTIKRIMDMGILELVIPSGSSVSGRTLEKNTLLSARTLQTGMSLPDTVEKDTSYTSSLLYQEYLMQKLGNFMDPSQYGLSYQIEYILAGKYSDRDNLASIAEELLLIREGVNLTSLMADSSKRAQAAALALAIASAFLVPPASGVIESALILCWSFAESVLDVRELFSGGKVPLVKSSAGWQLSLENLPYLLQEMDSARKNDQSGLSYEDYLQILLLAKGKSDKIMRGMDMIEASIRGQTGRSDFRLDSGLVAIEVSLDVKANKRKTFTVTRQYSYD